jgi:hypothetical protein
MTKTNGRQGRRRERSFQKVKVFFSTAKSEADGPIEGGGTSQRCGAIAAFWHGYC